jgi:hypothetical protein
MQPNFDFVHLDPSFDPPQSYQDAFALQAKDERSCATIATQRPWRIRPGFSSAITALKITNSQSLELIAKAFGVADWNTLAATIRGEVSTPHTEAATPSPASIDAGIRPRVPRFSSELERTLQRALAHGDARKHQYTTCEHLLLALTDDPNASKVMQGCRVDLTALKKGLTEYIDNDLRSIVVETGASIGGSRPTTAFQRVMQRAEAHAEQTCQMTCPCRHSGLLPE